MLLEFTSRCSCVRPSDWGYGSTLIDLLVGFKHKGIRGRLPGRARSTYRSDRA
ncbi:uncharacterized protein BO66DRAFT_391276 [Aspergillus aculeatinus CBS 121060]|uniref:Uncharacterized protein n=1 Tax=Aspergillus aculeatinus CBS 121060 TaxID=1448322 RepID=A0ACD1HB22_9EURO|nr:hypothetical protein BO66DRAFT_391276 [Aspergillus aculeatinus CBS 121060]RAH70830.1 hypothetical protein BO66DRAFT_391276 [Aspergillus aculeatinus CBS 121060]